MMQVKRRCLELTKTHRTLTMSNNASSNGLANLHRLALVLCGLTFTLIVWGGHVNTTRSGMAFPDWPTSNLAPMVTYAPSEWLWQSDRFWEHGHRLLASLVGLVTVVLGVGIYRRTPLQLRPSKVIMSVLGGILLIMATAIVGMQSMPTGFMESVMVLLAIMLVTALIRALRTGGEGKLVWLAMAAFLGVCLQGAFGGYTVRNNLPDWTSTTHGMLAQIFFMMVIGITLLTSKRWQTAERRPVDGRSPRAIVTVTWAITIVQFLLGALTRHTDAWGVSVSWPHWDEAGFFPSGHLLQYGQVVIHVLHRTVAYAVAAMVILQWITIVRRRSQLTDLVLPASINVVLVLLQIALGAMILWTARGEFATTAHVATGVLLLVFNTITMFNLYRLYAIVPSAEVAGRVVVGQGTR
ncbi:MAG: hypothetical protein FGM24_03810 [Candidatus Kapabacteria bacterium]|nr:hypothetical protein [Candidatus Kapabacteria bacterium]